MIRGHYLGLAQALLIIVPLTIVVRASNNMLMTTIPLLARYGFHFSNTLIGLLSALTALMTFLSSGLINSRLRSCNRRLAFIASSVIYAVAYPLFWLSTPLTIWLLSAIAGFTLGFLMPNIITSASLLPDRRTRERLLNIYTLSLSISLILGPAIESLILKYYSLRESFLFFTVFPILALAIAPFIKFPEETSNDSLIAVSNVLSNPGFLTAVLNIATYNVVFSFLMAFGGIYARNSFGLSYSTVETLFSLFFVTSFLGRLYLSIKPAERLWPLMSSAVLLTVIGIALIGLINNLLIYIIALLLLGIPHGTTYPLSVVAISRAFKPQHRNMANSLFFSFMMLIGIVTPTITGYVADLIGIRNTFIVLILPVIIILLFLRRYVNAVDKPLG
ncbi:MFS transporter [Caldivirga maquilingensis]|uniref:Major facilitator superfamily MFS_1 n=1 Tax=Caldivirga maquilingensis (strain ATCC 700844 / DSM 13496 / JCM 10307 / IC-167) TaxID=397948 RepID=A8MCD8_CALMQ|nr:MFS transporter [Caldivirga maquilingensis]ABW01444.1 major facilitator superfamily MFS_1 [Caldivirga maquilingensis IC-167]